MNILINGLGCAYSGSKLILEEILKSAPSNSKITVIIPVVKDSKKIEVPKNIKAIELKHSLWGMYLRIFLELYINIMLWRKKYDFIINLSSYGLCFSKKQILYIHNPLILDMSMPFKFGQGNGNFLVRLALNTYLRRGEAIFLQTDHMYSSLQKYCLLNRIPFPKNAKTLKPQFPTPPDDFILPRVYKNFGFELFYPSSHFPHKRTDLAIESTILAQEKCADIGLTLTIEGYKVVNNIRFLGFINVAEVHAYFKMTDALLFTSERETLGLPLLEALYYYKPAVLPYSQYAIEIYGDAGVYYKENTAESICEAIIYLYSNFQKYAYLVHKRRSEELEHRLSWAKHWEEFTSAVS